MKTQIKLLLGLLLVFSISFATVNLDNKDTEDIHYIEKDVSILNDNIIINNLLQFQDEIKIVDLQSNYLIFEENISNKLEIINTIQNISLVNYNKDKHIIDNKLLCLYQYNKI